ncbi:MAG: lipopolysaccharide export system permease protein [Alteromonadaceae bacterium]|jgi:lipopolysaccharide export system permease protein
MIIFRYLVKEVAKAEFAVFIILMAVFISNEFVNILGKATEGGIPGQLVMIFIALRVPDLVSMILPLSFFLGVLLAYGRIYADSEMTILHACGISEWYVVRVTLTLGVITALVTGIFTLYLTPLAAEYEYQVKETLAADSGLSALMPGRFQKTGNEKAVVFIHNKNRVDGSLEKVFVAQLPKNHDDQQSIINTSLVYAAKGEIVEEDSGLQRLILSNGIRYKNDIKNNEFREVAFSKYYIQIEDQKIEHKRRKLRAIPTNQLFDNDSPNNHAEIHWRIAFPLVCLIVTFIAVPLSVVNPRQGKFAKMLPALILFLSYFLMLTALRSGIESGAMPSLIGLWPVHLSALILGGILLSKDRPQGKRLLATLLGFRRSEGVK